MALAITIIGAGKVGSALARSLALQGYEIVGVSSRSAASAGRLAEKVGAKVFDDSQDALRRSDAILICTPDGEIAKVACSLADKSAPKIALHTAGSLGRKPLQALQDAGWETGCLHPLQTLAGDDPPYVWQNVFFAVDGSEQALALAKKIATDLGGEPFALKEHDRPHYHAAACAASNYLTVLVQWAVRRYAEIGFASENALQALLPLMQGTLANLERVGAEAALTGPISRGDAVTLEAHLKLLPGGWEDEIYRSLGRGALESSFAQKRIDESTYQKIADLLIANKGAENEQ